MLHVFSTNRVKLVIQTPTTTIKKRHSEYVTNKVPGLFLDGIRIYANRAYEPL